VPEAVKLGRVATYLPELRGVRIGLTMKRGIMEKFRSMMAAYVKRALARNGES
jgi:hypothetical protein